MIGVPVIGRAVLRLVAVILFFTGLASCSALRGDRTVEGENIPAASEPVTETAVPAPEPLKRPGADQGSPAGKSDAAAGEAPAESEVVAAIPPPGIYQPEGSVKESPNLDRLMGLEFAAVERLLGPADEMTDVPPAKTWRYRDGECSLVISFYPDLEALSYRVLSYKVETQTEAPEGEAQNAQERCRYRFAERFRPRS